MINKGELQAIISKYNLGGMIDAVKWTVKDKQLTIKYNAPTKDMIGEVVHTKFDLEDSEFAVYNTSQLDKLLSITSGEYLGKEPLTIFFHHILPKEKYPEACFDEENIILLTLDEHTNVESNMYKYDIVNTKRQLLLSKYQLV